MEIVIIFVLIAINGFFALSEIAFVSSRRENIESLKANGSKNAEIILQMMDQPDRFLSSIQVGITLVGVLSGVYGGVAIADDISKIIFSTGLSEQFSHNLALILVVGIITYLSIVLGELAPKTIGIKNPEKIILVTIPYIKFFSVMTHPVISFLSWSTRIVLRLFGVKQSKIDESDDPVKEILGLAKVATLKNKLSREQENIIKRTTKLKSTSIENIMVKLSDMRYLSTDMSLNDALVASHIHHHTRFPLIESISREIVGYVNFKDIVNTLRLNPVNPTLKGICRPIISFKTNETINSVLQRLIITHQHIALIRDTANIVRGMVTMEDILETIVGDIKDEYDSIPDHFYEMSPGRFVAGGGLKMKSISASIGGSLPPDERTIDLWIRENFKTAIRVETKISFNEFVFIVRKVSRSHIYEIIIECPSMAAKSEINTIQAT